MELCFKADSSDHPYTRRTVGIWEDGFHIRSAHVGTFHSFLSSASVIAVSNVK
jgi:hypothetical protein